MLVINSKALIDENNCFSVWILERGERQYYMETDSISFCPCNQILSVPPPPNPTSASMLTFWGNRNEQGCSWHCVVPSLRTPLSWEFCELSSSDSRQATPRSRFHRPASRKFLKDLPKFKVKVGCLGPLVPSTKSKTGKQKIMSFWFNYTDNVLAICKV